MRFGRWLKRWRIKRWPSWSQVKVADEIGLSASRVGRIERGEASPTLAELEIIGAFFGEEAGDFLVKLGYTKQVHKGEEKPCRNKMRN